VRVFIAGCAGSIGTHCALRLRGNENAIIKLRSVQHRDATTAYARGQLDAGPERFAERFPSYCGKGF